MAHLNSGSHASNSIVSPNGDTSHRPGIHHGLCSNFADLTQTLRAELDKVTKSGHRFCVTIQLALRAEISLPLLRPIIGPYAEGGIHDLPGLFKTHFRNDADERVPTARIEDIVTIKDPQVRTIVQRAASRGVVKSIQDEDGFKYTFNNAWNSKDNEGSRFSYICQDSMQNKDRHANGFTKTQKHLKGVGDRGPRKPTYDCRGSISVKFSLSKRYVEVYYRHVPLHTTVAQRKPLGSAQQTSRKVSTRDESNHERQVPSISLTANVQTQSMEREFSKKRKREDVAPTRNSSQPPSLSELLSQSQAAHAAPPEAIRISTKPLHKPPTLAYDLPEWQKPMITTQPAPHNAPFRDSAFPQNPHQLHGWSQRGQSQTPNTLSAYGAGAPIVNHDGSHSTFVDAFHGKPSAQSQGLFQTLKPISNNVKPSPSPKLRSGKSMAQNACNGCKHAKIMCDEGRPACSACQQRDKSGECSYIPTQKKGPETRGGVVIRWQLDKPQQPPYPPQQLPWHDYQSPNNNHQSMAAVSGITPQNPLRYMPLVASTFQQNP